MGCSEFLSLCFICLYYEEMGVPLLFLCVSTGIVHWFVLLLDPLQTFKNISCIIDTYTIILVFHVVPCQTEGCYRPSTIVRFARLDSDKARVLYSPILGFVLFLEVFNRQMMNIRAIEVIINRKRL